MDCNCDGRSLTFMHENFDGMSHAYEDSRLRSTVQLPETLKVVPGDVAMKQVRHGEEVHEDVLQGRLHRRQSSIRIRGHVHGRTNLLAVTQTSTCRDQLYSQRVHGIEACSRRNGMDTRPSTS